MPPTWALCGREWAVGGELTVGEIAGESGVLS